jgi:hypothetical protein
LVCTLQLLQYLEVQRSLIQIGISPSKATSNEAYREGSRIHKHLDAPTWGQTSQQAHLFLVNGIKTVFGHPGSFTIF